MKYGLRSCRPAGKAIIIPAALLFFLALLPAAQAQSTDPTRTIFVIGDHNGTFTWPLRAFTYQDNTLIEAETWRSMTRSIGPVGLAVDPFNDHLFVSYEGSAVVDAFTATDATPLDQIFLVGTGNLAGMDVHLGRGIFYVVNRMDKTVFEFDSETFAPVDQWELPSGLGAIDIKIVENFQGHDVLFVSDSSPTIRWYDIDAHDELGSVTESTYGAVGMGVYVKEDGNAIIFTGAIIMADSLSLTKLDVAEGTEESINLNANARGVYVSQTLGQVFTTVGTDGASPPTLRVYDVNTFTEITRINLEAAWSPCDVKGTWLAFGSTVKKDCTSHPNGQINMTEDVVFTVTLKNKYDRPIHVLPVKDTYDTTQLTFVSSTPAVDDPADDGEVGWADLIPIIGHDLAFNEEYTVTLNFKAEPENCTSGNVTGTNVALMTGARDDRGTALDDASGTFEYKIWCNCVTDADCEDGVWCNGAEHCVDRQCKSDGNPCPVDDSLWCNGQETITCIEATQECGHTGDPCAGLSLDWCNPITCEEETQACVYGDNPCPDDNLFCNGTESCVPNKVDCQHSGNPCDEGEQCDENLDKCVPFNIDDDTESPGDDTASPGWPEGKVTGGCCGCG